MNCLNTTDSQNTEIMFSLGLSYSEVIELNDNELRQFLSYTPREEIIEWLQWNDFNGVYKDEPSLLEFGNIIVKRKV